MPSIDVSNNITFLHLVKFSKESVHRGLSKLNSSNCCGPDGIPNVIFKKFSEQLLNPLCSIFEVSFQQKKIPAIWKLAFVKPLFKKSNPHFASNYRPLSLNCVGGKIMESVISENIIDHFVKNDLIYKN